MKNKIFEILSIDRKEKILSRVLRMKTNGLLRINEEVALLSALKDKKQFRICVYNDINVFAAELNANEFETIYGAKSIALLTTGGTLIDTVIAAFACSKNSVEKRNCDSLHIYIPESRRCKNACIREKVICENLENYDSESFCCGLHRVQV